MKTTKLKLILPMALSGLMMANATFAETLNTSNPIDTCESMSKAIFQAIQDNRYTDAECVYEVVGAGTFLKTAARELRQGNYQQAIIDMLSAEKNMRVIQLHPEKCRIFPELVKYFIKPIMTIKYELSEEVDID